MTKRHIIYSHKLWKKHLKNNCQVIDATCGNGKDTLFLLKQTKGKVYCFDIQKIAIEKTKLLLKKTFKNEDFNRTKFFNLSHEHLNIIEEQVSLIVYNLGYLPGGDKTITTTCKSTIKSLSQAMRLLNNKGAISIMCYPGHSEGEIEEKAILNFLSNISLDDWEIFHYRWIKKNKKTPSLVWIKKRY